MCIFNSLDKTKYIVVLSLLMTFAVFILSIHVGETFVNSDFPIKSGVYFDKNIRSSLISTARTKILVRYEDLKQRHRVVRQAKILPMSKFVLEKNIHNVYATVRVPYYTEVCKLLTQLIIIYIFLTDGKKRSLKLS